MIGREAMSSAQSGGAQAGSAEAFRPQRPAAARQNNFDALRLVAAASVVFSHSFLIAEGNQDHETLIWLTDNRSILGLVGVFVFFAISGFLVTQISRKIEIARRAK
jgi:peptidoglycan/LPS O-acetylase OafA/YrhL